MKGKSALGLAGIFLAVAGMVLLIIFGIGNYNRLSITNIRQGLDLQGGVSILYQADIENPTSDGMNAALALIRARLDNRGYVEASTAIEGTRQIRVDIPGVDDPVAAEQEIGATASLVFMDEHGNVILTGEHVSNAFMTMQPSAHGGAAEPVVALEFNAEGTQLFGDATRANIGRQIFIFMDDEMISNAVVQTAITDGSGIISGGFSAERANLLATQIRQGSLPFGLEVISSSTVGARLGAGALQSSVIAGIIGLALVLTFMLIFYRTMGLAADIALVIYVVIFLLLISGFGIVLSLPGIAGLILSIGMATDANIVIFERIREEVASGKSLKVAMRTGYKRALPAIIDSNVTTLIAGVVLFYMGTGPIMGFAQMLVIGILLSMFTCLFVTRIVTICLMNLGVIKSGHMLGKAQKDALAASTSNEPIIDTSEKPIVQKRKIYFMFSSAIIAICVIVGIINMGRGVGFFNLDVEFSGGTSFEIFIEQDFNNSDIEEIVRNITGESAPQVQAFSNANGSGVMIRTTATGMNYRTEISAEISEMFNLDADAFTYSDVSPAVSQAMRRSAIMAVIVASIGMLVYISIRFRDVRKGASAVMAQLHDALVVLGIYVLLRIPLNYAFIAVILTTLGYSINATIIIFDRIRENRRRMPKADNESLINMSVTQTLRRTLFSTLSSFIAVFMLYVIGVAAIRDFTLPIMVGLLFGAYSSVCLSGSVWYMMVKRKKEK